MAKVENYEDIYFRGLMIAHEILEIFLSSKISSPTVFCFTVSSTEGLTATCAAAFELS